MATMLIMSMMAGGGVVAPCAIVRSNPFYADDDRRNEVHLVDAYGGVMHVSPDFLKYRDRIINTSDVRTLHMKGRRVLVNHFKSNMSVPTMCVHFAEKTLAVQALNTIQSILWNLPSEDIPSVEGIPFVDDEEEEEDEEVQNDNSIMRVIEKPADPSFLAFMAIGTSVLLILNVLRMMLGSGDPHDEL